MKWVPYGKAIPQAIRKCPPPMKGNTHVMSPLQAQKALVFLLPTECVGLVTYIAKAPCFGSPGYLGLSKHPSCSTRFVHITFGTNTYQVWYKRQVLCSIIRYIILQLNNSHKLVPGRLMSRTEDFSLRQTTTPRLRQPSG